MQLERETSQPRLLATGTKRGTERRIWPPQRGYRSPAMAKPVVVRAKVKAAKPAAGTRSLAANYGDAVITVRTFITSLRRLLITDR